MAASQAATFSSRLSPSLRHLLLRTRSNAIPSAAAFSLTGKLPSPTTPTSTEKPNLLGRVDWPAFPHQNVVIEAASKSIREVNSNDEEESGDEFDDEFGEFSEDDVLDEDDSDDDYEETDDDDDQGKGNKK